MAARRRGGARVGNVGDIAPDCSHCSGSGKEPAPPVLIFAATLQIKTVSEPNVTGRLRAKLRRKRLQREGTLVRLRALMGRREGGPPSIRTPLEVLLVRIGPRKLDSDNVHGALKHVRDGVADWLNVDDGDERVSWDVKQEKGATAEYAVRVEIRQRKQ